MPATLKKPRRSKPFVRKIVGQTFRIASNQFDYLMYAADVMPGQFPWSDLIEEAHLYDEQDNREFKLKFWRGMAKVYGLDPECVQIVEG